VVELLELLEHHEKDGVVDVLVYESYEGYNRVGVVD
jgi:hypothetical protein